MARINLGVSGLSLGPDDPCVDPLHPWWLPDLMHTAAECECIYRNGRSTEEQCIFAMPGGTEIPGGYTKPADVPSVGTVILQTPGYVAGQVANAAGTVAGAAVAGAATSLNLPGLLLLAGAGFIAYKYLTK